MNDQVHEAMALMSIQDLRRAIQSSERARDDELVSILSERLAAVSPPMNRMPAR